MEARFNKKSIIYLLTLILLVFPCLFYAKSILFRFCHCQRCQVANQSLFALRLEQVAAKPCHYDHSDFQRANLSKALIRVEGVSMRFSDFRQATLTGARIFGLDARFSNFSQAQLTSARIAQCSDLRDTDFVQADLRHIRILPVMGECGARLQQANFSHADLRSAWIEAILLGANFTHANLQDAHIQLVVYDDSKAQGRRLQVFNHINFAYANLRSAVFTSQDYTLPVNAFTDIDFSHANLQGLQWRIKGLSLAQMLHRVTLCRTVLPDGVVSDRDCRVGASKHRWQM